jgi:hypothetical protein
LVHQLGVAIGIQFRIGRAGDRIVATAAGESAKESTNVNDLEQCPAIGGWQSSQFASAPLRASAVGTVVTARRALQNALDAESYRYNESAAGQVVTDWSAAYNDPATGRLRKHALLFEFVPEVGGTDIVIRWLLCSSATPEGPWVVLGADKLAQPADIEAIIARIRQR